MTEYLKLEKANCKNCHKCIRHCPVKAISFSEGQANILPEDCILCGECYVTCPQNAKSVRADLPRAREMVSGPQPVWASIAPSFVAAYPGVSIQSMEAALMALGFAGAEETALGATIVKAHYDEMLEEEDRDILISSCCHSVNTLIQKYYPEALPYLARVMSPMQAHCQALKEAHPNAKTIFIGPCISKKAEAESYPGIVDCVLTFDELEEWLSLADIQLEASPKREQGGKARLFPIPGGIIRSMKADHPAYSYIAVDGVQACMDALKDIAEGELDHCFVEMSACRGGCIGGPVIGNRSPLRGVLAVNAAAGAEDFAVSIPSASALEKELPALLGSRPKPGGRAIEKVLRSMGKTLPEHELNCGTCGYDTCREKAAAVLLGKAELSMCLPHLMEKTLSFSDNIIRGTPNGVIVLNEALEIQQLNAAGCQLLQAKNERDVLGRQVVTLMDPTPFFEVFQTRRNIYDQHMYLPEYRKHITLSVVLDAPSNLLICILRDTTQEETVRAQKEELSRKTVEITDRVVEKQMRAVQEIASLLGETTAETKVALTKLKETLQNE